MAIVPVTSSIIKLGATHLGTNTYVLGDASDGVVGTFVVHIVDTGSLSASIAVKARSRNPDADAAAVTFVAWRYSSDYINGSLGDATMINTAITTTSLIRIPASGVQIALDVTFTSGTATIYIVRIEGAAV